MPPKKFNKLEQELELEHGEYGLPVERTEGFLGLQRNTWIIILGFVIIIPFVISILVIDIQNKKEISDIGTPISSDPSGINNEIIQYLIENAANTGCENSLTVHPVATCDMLCEKEFSTVQPIGEQCKPLQGVTLDNCKEGCLCCGMYNDCLLKNNNDVTHCKEQLPTCKFEDPGVPIDSPSNVCLATLSQNYCFRVGVGFNPPITCSSA